MDEKDQAQERLRDIQAVISIGVYQHYKGPYYTVFALSVKEDTCGHLVHYYSHDHKTRWTRDLEDFTSSVNEATRFKFVRDATAEELLQAVGLVAAVTIIANPLGLA